MTRTVHWRDARAALADALRGADPRLIGLDFDGTLAPYVDRPEEARLEREVSDILERLADAPQTTVALISGRMLVDVRERVGLTAAVYAGNHGFEICGEDFHFQHPVEPAFRSSLQRLIERAGEHLSDCAGVWWEDKQHTATFHYRLAPEADHARIAEIIHELAAAELDLTLHHGRLVWEFRPRQNWNKGTAFGWLLQNAGVATERSIYVGDDETDEHVFRAYPQAATIAVGVERPTAARFHADDVQDVARLLYWLADEACVA